MSRRPVCRSCGAHRHKGEPHTADCPRVLVLSGGGAKCPCGASIEWTGDLDADGREWFDAWWESHAACEEVA